MAWSLVRDGWLRSPVAVSTTDMDVRLVKGQHRMPATRAGIVSVKGAAGPACARRALDRIGALAAAPAAHVLDDSYAALFDDSQIELRRRLLAVWKLIDDGSLDAATEAGSGMHWRASSANPD